MDVDNEDISEGARFFMYRSQSQVPDDRKKIRNKYQELIDDAQREKENEDFNVDNIMKNMCQADELFKEVCRPQEAIFDARLVGIHSEIAKKRAHEIQVGSPFNPTAFLRKLAYELTGQHSDSDVIPLGDEAWVKLGSKVCHMFNMTPKVNFIQGTFVEPVESTRQQQKRAKEKEVKVKSTEPRVIDPSQRESVAKTYDEIQKIKKILSKKFKRNGGVPICYFSFTVDPTSFSRTIENMFHMSFLIKEREVYLSMDSNKLPVIEPVAPGHSSACADATQSVLTMNVHKWKQLVEVFEITKPAIPPST